MSGLAGHQKIHYHACTEGVTGVQLVQIIEVPDKRGLDNRGCTVTVLLLISIGERKGEREKGRKEGRERGEEGGGRQGESEREREGRGGEGRERQVK